MQVPGPPGRPWAEAVEVTALTLRWEPPAHVGGSEVRSYRLLAQTGGMDGFKVLLDDTGGSAPEVRVTRLEPTTWYEFEVAAINYNGLGPPSPPSER